ncbi:hypothetical protein AVEN_204248-1, partial [Araneus ventricosus]
DGHDGDDDHGGGHDDDHGDDDAVPLQHQRPHSWHMCKVPRR